MFDNKYSVFDATFSGQCGIRYRSYSQHVCVMTFLSNLIASLYESLSCVNGKKDAIILNYIILESRPICS